MCIWSTIIYQYILYLEIPIIFIVVATVLGANPRHVYKLQLYIYILGVFTEKPYSSLQQFYPRMKQAGRDRKISDRHRKGCSCPMCESGLPQMM